MFPYLERLERTNKAEDYDPKMLMLMLIEND